ncbi:MAG: AbrB/MazE/SpoVT family DNA-binding domain-containing protein [Clostridia bacterium]|nr:AbrB/MazE/SpoVT family DNA-binding domain-containing protein [Clostridia bacterium]
MSKGIVRAVDKMGRVVIPKELREQLGVKNEIDSFDIYQDGDKIILEKYRPFCVFCNKLGPSVKIGEYAVCNECIDKLNEARDNKK